MGGEGDVLFAHRQVDGIGHGLQLSVAVPSGELIARSGRCVQLLRVVFAQEEVGRSGRTAGFG